ncbi:MAG TPA: hypothetical protein VN922_19155, partial [Bacteroidia bacterium]|nr:hypothetical protein [Bacteroidia bacterium]
HGALEALWEGFVWCNPPYTIRNEKIKWVKRMVFHNNGLMLMPDRTSTPWWHYGAKNCSGFFTVAHKIKFRSPDGTIHKQPSTGNTIFAWNDRAMEAIWRAEKNDFGICHQYSSPKIYNYQRV